jgi:hypothetical protein
MLVSRKERELVVEENAVDDMYLWYLSLDDVDYLVDVFYIYSVQ